MQDDLFETTLAHVSRSLRGQIQNHDWLQSWISDGEALRDARRQYHAKLDTLVRETKPEFLPAKKAALQAAFAQVLQAHKAQHVDGLAPHINQLASKATPKESPTDTGAILRFLRQQELRQDIKAKYPDPLLLRAEYETRVQDVSPEHDDWLAAVEDAPTPMLPGEVLDVGKAARARRQLDPKVRQSLTDLETLREATEHLLNLAARELPAEDPVQTMAREGGAHEGI